MNINNYNLIKESLSIECSTESTTHNNSKSHEYTFSIHNSNEDYHVHDDHIILIIMVILGYVNSPGLAFPS